MFRGSAHDDKRSFWISRFEFQTFFCLPSSSKICFHGNHSDVLGKLFHFGWKTRRASIRESARCSHPSNEIFIVNRTELNDKWTLVGRCEASQMETKATCCLLSSLLPSNCCSQLSLGNIESFVYDVGEAAAENNFSKSTSLPCDGWNSSFNSN